MEILMAEGVPGSWSVADIEELLASAGVGTPIASVEVRDDWNGPAMRIALEDGARCRITIFPEEKAQARKEAALSDRVATETHVPVPPILGVDIDASIGPQPSILALDPDGLPVFDIAGLSPTNQRRLFEEMGASIARLHTAFAFGEFGVVGETGDSIPEGMNTWERWMIPQIEMALDQLDETIQSNYLQAISACVDDARSAFMKKFEPTLIKGTYRFPEILVDPDSDPLIVALRGLGEAIAAPAEYGYALAMWEYCERSNRSPSFREAFNSGYGSVRSVPSGDGFRRRRDCYHLQWLLGELVRFTSVDDPQERNTGVEWLTRDLDRVLGGHQTDRD